MTNNLKLCKIMNFFSLRMESDLKWVHQICFGIDWWTHKNQQASLLFLFKNGVCCEFT
jgi:hypothetical protein